MFRSHVLTGHLKWLLIIASALFLSACVLESEAPLLTEQSDFSSMSLPDISGDYYPDIGNMSDDHVFRLRHKKNTTNSYVTLNARDQEVTLIIAPLKKRGTLLMQFAEKDRNVLLVPARLVNDGIQVYLPGDYDRDVWKEVITRYGLTFDSKLMTLQSGADKESFLQAIDEMFARDALGKGELFRRQAE